MNYNNLEFRKNMPIDLKIQYSEKRIKQWHHYWNGNIVVSYSGGKDSIVLLDLVRNLYPDIQAVFFNTGLEYPEIIEQIKKTNNTISVRPKLTFRQVIEKYGYPVISKEVSQKIEEIRNTKSAKLKNKRLFGDKKGHGKLPEKWKFLIDAPFRISGKCCNYLKKKPAKQFDNMMIGTKITDSRLRSTSFHQCNQYNTTTPKSMPISFWTDYDIWEYIKAKNLEYPPVYDFGLRSTGCMFCLFGYQYEFNKKNNRISFLKNNHPKLYNYCMDSLGIGGVIDYLCKNRLGYPSGFLF